jgi:radical SAM-linked protein
VSVEQIPQTPTENAATPHLRLRVRVRFTKQDDLRWISHRDLMRVWERLFRRAGVALSMTEGFHPKPRINFPSALAVGIAGMDELLEVDLAEIHTPDSLRTIIEPQLPPGMMLGAIEVLPAPDRKAQVTHVTFEQTIPADRQSALAERMVWLLAQSEFVISREGRTAPLDLRPLVDDLTLIGGVLRMRLNVSRDGSARPREVLEALQISDLEHEGHYLTRTSVEIELESHRNEK